VIGPGQHQQVTELLGLEPMTARNAGDLTHAGVPSKCMYWELKSGLPEDRLIAEHIESLLIWLMPRATAIQELWLDNMLYFQCGTKCTHTFGLHLSREHVRQMAVLGIGIDFDGYAVDESGSDDT
jgi:hypothetical protein